MKPLSFRRNGLFKLPGNVVCSLLSLVVLSCSGSMNASLDAPPTNMAVMTRLTERVVGTITRDAGIAPQDTCVVTFTGNAKVAFLEHAFIESLRRFGPSVRGEALASGNTTFLDIQPSQAGVEYEGTFRDGIFGEEKAVRLVSVEFSAQVTRSPDKRVVFGGVVKEQLRDTIPLRSIESVESPILTVTHARPPGGSFVERFLEPLVVLAATGVVIYLFFTVRS